MVFSGAGACVVFSGGMRGFFRGHVWFFPGVSCMVFSGGMHDFFRGGGMHRIRRDTVNERAVRILLECILVVIVFKLDVTRISGFS